MGRRHVAFPFARARPNGGGEHRSTRGRSAHRGVFAVAAGEGSESSSHNITPGSGAATCEVIKHTSSRVAARGSFPCSCRSRPLADFDEWQVSDSHMSHADLRSSSAVACRMALAGHRQIHLDDAGDLHPAHLPAQHRAHASSLKVRPDGRSGARGARQPTRDRRLHDRPTLAPRVTRSSSSCSNVSPIASAAPVPAASRASFEG